MTTSSSIKVNPREERDGTLGFLIEKAFPEECLDETEGAVLDLTFPNGDGMSREATRRSFNRKSLTVAPSIRDDIKVISLTAGQPKPEPIQDAQRLWARR